MKSIPEIKTENNSDIVIAELRHIIERELTPLIKNGFYLADAPYYHNIGDVLIWEGIRSFCRNLPGKNLGTSNITTFLFPEIPPDATILLMGGGNFGDLWREFQDFRLEVVRRYPHNQILMFPQSVCYRDSGLIKKDATVFASHCHLHLCARDEYSYNFMRTNMPDCNVHLVPDMAFYIDRKVLKSYLSRDDGRKLYLKRMDKELVDDTVVDLVNAGYEVRDWPTYERQDPFLWFSRRMQGVSFRTKNVPYLRNITAKFTDSVSQIAVRHHLVTRGLDFLSPYSDVVTTRLHTMILAVLLNKKVKYIDNSTGKLSAFAKTWFSNLDSVSQF